MGSRWTADDIPDLTGRVAVVTGANSGLGYETARELARHGAHTVLACRDLDAAGSARGRLLAEIPDGSVEVRQLDLADLRSVRAFADAFRTTADRLDLLVNNAGVMATPYWTTVDGFEGQVGTNHLGHFALTGLLLGLLLDTDRSRVVTVSSGGHRLGSVADGLLHDQDDYSPMRAYGRSKLANLLFTYELQRRLQALPTTTLALAAHPGSSRTALTRHLERNPALRVGVALGLRLAQSARMGALPTLRAATDPAAIGGQYYGPDGFLEQRGHPVVVGSSGASHRADHARWLWATSAELTGVSYPELGPRPGTATG